jgi:hypothetical protein
MPYPTIKEMNDSINSKSKPLHSIWTYDMDNEANEPHLIIPIPNIINIEHYDL